MEPDLDLPGDWREAIARAASARTVLVLGPTDVGKSSFIRALARCLPDLWLLDLDPGQKMVGPPGSASLGILLPRPKVERFAFLGSTAVGGFHQLLGAAASLLPAARTRPLVVNTSGYVAGPGARLQMMTIEALRPDLVVAIAVAGPLEAALGRVPGLAQVRLDRSPAARRKSEGARRAIRQQSFADALSGAREWLLDRAAIDFKPAPPLALGPARLPVCALADAHDEDMEIGLLCGEEDGMLRILSRPPPRRVRRLRLGKLWALTSGEEVRLLDTLEQAWLED